MTAQEALKIDFTSSGNSGTFVVDGWGVAEPAGTWTVGRESRLRLSGLDRTKSYVANLSVAPYIAVPAVTKQHLTVTVCNEVAYAASIDSRQVIEFEIPLGNMQPSVPIEVRFLCPDSVAPQAHGISNDRRQLGILVRTMTLIERKTLQARGQALPDAAIRGRKMPSDTGARLASLVKRGLQLTIGRYSYGEPNVQFNNNDPKASLNIGSFCSIATGCTIFVGTFGRHHDDFISTFPLGMVFREPACPDLSRALMGELGVTIGSDVWIGRNATIMAGVTIGHGAIIGTASVVVKDVPPYGIAVGAPAKVIRYRFENRQIERLLSIRWWDWSDQRIEDTLDLFYRRDIDAVLDMMELCV